MARILSMLGRKALSDPKTILKKDYGTTPESDEYLINAYREGDEGVFTELVERHLKSTYSFAVRLTGNENDAEDIVQESFLKAWKHLKKFDPQKARFKTWLMQIVRNTAIDSLRKKRIVPLSTFDIEGENVLSDTLPDDAPLPDEIAAYAGDVAALESALQQLSPPYREILLLYNGNDFSFDEAASILKIPTNTAKSRHRRAIQTLRDIVRMHPNR